MENDKKERRILDFFKRKVNKSSIYKFFVKQKEVDQSENSDEIEEEKPFVIIPFKERIKIIERLENINDEEEIVQFLKDNRVRPSNFSGANLHDLIVTYYPEKYDELYTQITKKINIYRKNYADEKEIEIKKEGVAKRNAIIEEKRKKKLPFAHDVIQKFIESPNMKIKEFCYNEDIDPKIFSKSVNLVKEFDSNLYLKYSEKVENAQSQRFAIIVSKLNQIVSGIRNGIIMQNGDQRNFDIIDYYMIQKFNVDVVKNISAEALNERDYNCLNQFIIKNKIAEKNAPLNIKMILSETTIVDCKKDKNGNLLIETGRMIKEEEKLSVIEFMKSNHIPLNKRTYNVAFRRYLKNQLFDPKDKYKNDSNKN